jgi:hypothetical protein
MPSLQHTWRAAIVGAVYDLTITHT